MKLHHISKVAAIALSASLLGGTAFADDYDRGRDRDRHDDAQQQDQNDQDQNDNQRKRGKYRPDTQNQTQGQGQNQNQGQNQDRGDRYGGHQDQGQNQQNQDDNNADNRRDRNWGDNDRRRDSNDNLFNGQSRDTRDRRRADWDRFRRDLTSPQRFRIGVYHAPRGYYYRRWHHGERLPIAFYSRDYWLTNFIIFGLFAPPTDLVWVRYGPDALLVDRYTGEIVQVRYNVFYG